MKGFFNKIGIVISMLLLPSVFFAQYCNTFHQDYCYRSENKSFKLNGQSKSALFSKGQTSELSVVVYKGQDYRISLCMDENLGPEINFKIYETVKVKVDKVIETKTLEDEVVTCGVCNGSGETEGETCYECDGETTIATGDQVEVINKETRTVSERQKKLIYDNSENDYVNEIEFSAESTRRLTIEVSIPGESSGGGETSKRGKKDKEINPEDLGCVGILVEFMTTPKTGFYGTGF